MDWQTRDIELWRQKYTWGDIILTLSSEYPSEKFDKDKVRAPIRALPEYKARQECELNVVQPHRKTIMLNRDGSHDSDTVIRGNDLQMNDKDYLLSAHGFKPDEWELLFAKNSVYNVQIKGGSTDTYYASKITVKPRTDISDKYATDFFMEQVKSYSPVQPRICKPQGDHIFIHNISDLHLGQLSWGAESGENYDSKIAADRFKKLTLDALGKSPYEKYDEMVFIIGNDFFNTDTPDNTTTKGTVQANDVRSKKMYDSGCKLLVWGVETLREAFKTTPIKVILVPGNHDSDTMYHAAQHIKAWFRNDESVVFDTSPRGHKGFAYGATALLFTHGQSELRNLDWVYSEFRHLIGSTQVTEIHSGHMHRIKVEEKNGAIIRTNPSPAELDNWSYPMGYGSIAQSISRVYSKEKGLEYEIYSRV